ncbi:MAG: hypothetical protein IPH18_18285 [Chitinophagaceae bacterium]|nr:hypothetical protein [Chitinophagaceae bacterium]
MRMLLMWWGVSSITHLKEKTLPAAYRYPPAPGYMPGKSMSWLTGGGRLGITSKDIDDTIEVCAKRPASFASCETFKNLLDDWEGDKWFFHIDTDNIISSSRHAGLAITRDQVKGLDDLLITLPESIPAIVADARHTEVSTPSSRK